MALGVVILDMLKLSRILERREVPVQMPHPLVQVGISRPDVANVALEMLHIDGVEAHNRRVQTDICFCDCWRREEVGRRRLCEMGFETVQGLEELCYGLFVCVFGPICLSSVG
jgi:hypothetical protein